MFCSNCGTKMIEGAGFCQNCGAKAISIPEKSKTSYSELDVEERDNKTALKEQSLIRIFSGIVKDERNLSFIKVSELINEYPYRVAISKKRKCADTGIYFNYTYGEENEGFLITTEQIVGNCGSTSRVEFSIYSIAMLESRFTIEKKILANILCHNGNKHMFLYLTGLSDSRKFVDCLNDYVREVRKLEED